MRVGFKLETALPFSVIAPPAEMGEVFEVAGPGSAPRPLIWVAVAAPVGSRLVTNGHGYDSGGGASPATQVDCAQFAGSILGGGPVTLANPAAEIRPDFR